MLLQNSYFVVKPVEIAELADFEFAEFALVAELAEFEFAVSAVVAETAEFVEFDLAAFAGNADSAYDADSDDNDDNVQLFQPQ